MPVNDASTVLAQVNRECPIIYLVVPCYNEEEIISLSATRLEDKMNRLIEKKTISKYSKVMFINDGSRDNTLKLLYEIAEKNTLFSVVSLMGNSGHQNAILSGMLLARKYADAVITIDADLQQDIEALDEFIEKFKAGCDAVYGVRNDRSSDGVFKKSTATMYYKLMGALGSKVIPNHADYRLMSKKALIALNDYKEANLFLRGLIPTMGLTSDIVYFDVKKREAGESKYTLKKMMTLALDGITSFSTTPLHYIGGLGILTVLISLVMVIITIVDWLCGNNVPGYSTLLIVILLVGGIIMVSLGVIGEYIGKIYMETKNRPHYIIDTVILKDVYEE